MVFALAHDREATVSNARVGRGWRLRLRRCISMESKSQVQALNQLLDEAMGLGASEDTPLWRRDAKEKFSIHSSYA